MPPQIAGIVKRNRLAGLLVRRDPSFLDQLRQKFAVVEHFVITVELWVFIAERVKAMRARSDDLFDVVTIQGRPP